MCEVCGVALTRKPKEALRRFSERRTCGRVCAGRVNALPLESRSCATCGAPLVRRRKELSGNFRRRKTCGRSCAGRMQNGGPDYIVQDRGYETPCWVWQKAVNDQGYALLSHQRVHRIYYERDVAPVPVGMQLDHLCRVRSCVNPAHLEPVTPGGYGVFWVNGRTIRAHRFAYGLIPAGLQIDHLCRNRACVNPAHLEAVTQQENIRRGEGGQAAHLGRRSQCDRGHAFDETNTYIRPDGGRKCRSCRREYQRAYRERKRKAA